MTVESDEQLLMIFEKLAENYRNTTLIDENLKVEMLFIQEENFEFLRNDPESIYPLGVLCYYFLIQEKYQEALNLLEKAIIILPDQPILQFNLATTYYLAGNVSQALTIARKLDFKTIINDLSLIYPFDEDEDDDEYFFDDELDAPLYSEDDLAFKTQELFRSIYLFKQAGLNEQAIQSYKSLLELTDEPPCLLAELGALYMQVKNYKEAKKYLSKALQGNPGLYNACRCLAATHRILGEYELAVGVLKKAHKQNPTDDILLLELASAYTNLNHVSKAVICLEKALRLDPSLQFGLFNVPELEPILQIILEKKSHIVSTNTNN